MPGELDLLVRMSPERGAGLNKVIPIRVLNG